MKKNPNLAKARAITKLARQKGLNTYLLEEHLLCDLAAVRDGMEEQRIELTPLQLRLINAHHAEFKDDRAALRQDRQRYKRVRATRWVNLREALRKSAA